jgi:type I restriction enzyme S subunit
MNQIWNEIKLGKLVEVLDSKRIPITKKDRNPGDFPYYGATGIVDYVDDYLFDEQLVLLGEDGAKWNSGERSAFIISGKTWVNNHAHVLKPHREMLDDYWLVYNLNYQNLLSFVTGLTVPKLNQGQTKEILIPLPPLEIQKKIVDKLDQASAAIDTAKLNIEKNLENAKELFQSKLNEIFTQNGEEWVENKLSDVCEISPPKKESKLKLEDEELVSFVPMKNLGILKQDLILKENRTLGSVYSSYTYFANNDVLLAKITPCFENGKIGIAQNLKNGVGFGSSEFVVYRPNESIESEFLFYFLCRDKFRRYGEKVMTGAVGHKRIPKEFISDQLILTPSIEIQKNTINTLNKLKRKIQALESTYQQELNSLVELKKSILEKAFAGEL